VFATASRRNLLAHHDIITIICNYVGYEFCDGCGRSGGAAAVHLASGARGALVELFERHLIEPQEAVGIRVGGTFCDLEDPDRFVWFREFPDMDARRRSLEAFYFGPVWREYREAANATMLDSDNVLLLRPTSPPHPGSPPAGPRPPADSVPLTDEQVVVGVWEYPSDERFTAWLATTAFSALEDVLATEVAAWQTEPAPSTFPALPVRDTNAFVWSASFPDATTAATATSRLATDVLWAGSIAPRITAKIQQQQILRLQPTTRSQHQAPSVVPVSTTLAKERPCSAPAPSTD
jgi:hypothetical protein